MIKSKLDLILFIVMCLPIAILTIAIIIGYIKDKVTTTKEIEDNDDKEH